MSDARTDVLCEGLRFPECIRWHDGALWFAEKRGGRVARLVDGEAVTEVEVPGAPGGIGWLPDGRMLVVSSDDRRVFVVADGAAAEHADLSAMTVFKCNDMVVRDDGRAWVGDFGYDLTSGAPPAPASLVTIDPDGVPAPVADGLGFPNGMVVTAGGELVVAESAANRLTAFTIGADGALSARRTWADLQEAVPDGICLDAEGAIWVADPLHGQLVRVRDGGETTARVSTGERGAFACVLGGDDGRTLFACTYTEAATMDPSGPPAGAIEAVRVDVPSAGSP